MEEFRTVLILPTLNGSSLWHDWLTGLCRQTVIPEHVLIVDSSSDDDTREQASAAGFDVRTIPREEFDHGGTRNLAASWEMDADVLVYMTQDAILADPSSLQNIIACFADPSIGAVCGRQLPRPVAGPIEAHARLFNYPATSEVRDFDSAKSIGIKAAFISNSFAAYRRQALAEVGGFPEHNIVAEDMYVAARMLLEGWRIGYCAEATVFHSHDYRYLQEFQRYFSTGVFHAREPWIQKTFGKARGEGLRYLLSELRYLANENPMDMPSAVVRTLLKYAGFQMGIHERMFPTSFKAILSGYENYWKSV